MIPNKKLVRRHVAASRAVVEDSKPNTRYAAGIRSLPQINEIELRSQSPELNKTMQGKLVRKPSLDTSTTSPYAPSASAMIPRSLSVPKIKSKVNMGKGSGAPKGRASPEPEPWKDDSGSKRRQKGYMSLQIEQTQARASLKSSFASKEHLGGGFHTVSHANSRVNSVFSSSAAKIGKTYGKPPTPELFLGKEEDLRTVDASAIEKALSHSLGALQNTDLRTELRIYRHSFSEAIHISGPLASVLMKIKDRYEAWIDELMDKDTREIARFQTEIITLQNNILKEVEDKKSLMKKIEKLSRENIDLSHACENYENKCTEYQEKLYDIANTKLDNYPPSQDAWKLLISELETYKAWKTKAVRELKISQSKEKKLVELVHALKKRGYPVEEVYNTEIRNQVPVPKASVSHREYDGESERLVSGPPKAVPRPAQVPVLNLETVEPDIDSDSSSESSSYQDPEIDLSIRRTMSNSSTHSHTTGQEQSGASQTLTEENSKTENAQFKKFSASLRVQRTVVDGSIS